ncbi:hypothetical protein PENTCL1PPCAC_23324 [Pristionchus entomophagus]|uniref:Uncharacterized protein n=1 Tax=Pristionchus entomophagus TaxID=358040 RepID=A0AAV5U425_9BILA|nr:hypothetical protein PENTCL1PPCAC_23324 [Pristionchus entomophagus]
MVSLPLVQITQPFFSRSIRVRGWSSILNNLAGSNLGGSICIGIEIDSFQFLRSFNSFEFTYRISMPSRLSSHWTHPFEVFGGNFEWLFTRNEWSILRWDKTSGNLVVVSHKRNCLRIGGGGARSRGETSGRGRRHSGLRWSFTGVRRRNKWTSHLLGGIRCVSC